jgi:hypothetical protein
MLQVKDDARHWPRHIERRKTRWHTDGAYTSSLLLARGKDVKFKQKVSLFDTGTTH